VKGTKLQRLCTYANYQVFAGLLFQKGLRRVRITKRLGFARYRFGKHAVRKAGRAEIQNSSITKTLRNQNELTDLARDEAFYKENIPRLGRSTYRCPRFGCDVDWIVERRFLAESALALGRNGKTRGACNAKHVAQV
jgi:hypothetical protein